MQRITPFLWFDGKAEEAMNFYVSIFSAVGRRPDPSGGSPPASVGSIGRAGASGGKNSKVGRVTRYGEGGPGPKGTVMSATFQLDGVEFMALNGGPQFTFTPATSFFVSLETKKEIDTLWEKLSKGGAVLMELNKYPFSEQFGWVQDKFGLSWQLNLAKRTQRITPFLMYVGQQGKAEEAMHLYVSIFSAVGRRPDPSGGSPPASVGSIGRAGASGGKNSSITTLVRFGKGEQGVEGTVMHAVFSLYGQEFMAMDSNRDHGFSFTEAISFFVKCETQHEVDELWEKLSAGGQIQQCGWLKDKFGVSWQIVPNILGELLGDKDAKKAQRVMQAMLQMKKLDIQKLKQAYEQQ